MKNPDIVLETSTIADGNLVLKWGEPEGRFATILALK